MKSEEPKPDAEVVQNKKQKLEKDKATLNSAISSKSGAITNKEAATQKITKAYDDALSKFPSLLLPSSITLPTKDSLPTAEQQAFTMKEAAEKVSREYDEAKAAVNEYQTHWKGGQEQLQTWKGRFNNPDDPQTGHCRACHTDLNTARRKQMWAALKGKSQWPGDLSDTEAELHATCHVSPWSDVASNGQGSPSCRQSIQTEITARKAKNDRLENARKTKEALQESFEAAKSGHDTLQKADESIKQAQELAKSTQAEIARTEQELHAMTVAARVNHEKAMLEEIEQFEKSKADMAFANRWAGEHGVEIEVAGDDGEDIKIDEL